MEFIELKHSLRMEEWKQQVEDCLQSNLSTFAWCKANGIPKSSFHYRQQQVAMEFGYPSKYASVEEGASDPKPKGLVCSEKITVRYPHVVIEIPQGADPETVRQILHMVQAPC